MVFLIPIYFLIIAIEFGYAKRRNLKVYDEHEFYSHLLTGVGQQVFNLFWGVGLIALYQMLVDRVALFTPDPKNPLVWIALLLLSDLTWYIGHRLSHRMNFFVASHATHHQAEDFNHASALRQSWTGRPAMFLVFLPLAFFGFTPVMILASQVVSTFIQFFSHNGVLQRKLGPLEYIFITPRSHRIHHGTNAPYLDKNYGGIFSFWDRLFGTFQDLEPGNKVKIGAMSKFHHLDAFEANVNPYRRILFAMKNRTTIWSKVSVWFGTPESLDAELKNANYQELKPTRVKRTLDRSGRVEILIQFAFVTALLVALLTRLKVNSVAVNVSLGLLILAFVSRIGATLTEPNGLSLSPRSSARARNEVLP